MRKSGMFAKYSSCLAVTGSILLALQSAGAAVLAKYDFQNPSDRFAATHVPYSNAQDLTVKGLGPGTFSTGPGTSEFSSGSGNQTYYTPYSSGQDVFGFTRSSGPTQNSDNNYFEFIVGPGGGKMSLDSLIFKLERDSPPNTPAISYDVFASKDGFASSFLELTSNGTDMFGNPIPGFQTYNSNTLSNITPIDLSTGGSFGDYFQQLTGDVTFRIYVTDNLRNTGGGMRIDDIELDGTLPKPASMLAWLGLAGVGAVIGYRRRYVK